MIQTEASTNLFTLPPKKPLHARVLRDLKWFCGYVLFLAGRQFRGYRLRWEMKTSEWFYVPLLDKAERESQYEELEKLYGEWRAGDQFTRESVAVLESSKLVSAAMKYHLSPLDIEAEKHWQDGVAGRYLSDEVQRELRKRIAEARLAKSNVFWERFTKIGTFIAALIAAIAAVITAVHHH